MTYTPLRLSRFAAPEAAKVAKPAKVEAEAGPDRPAFATFATFAGVEGLSTHSAGALVERAAIVAEGARVPPEWAEGFAWLELLPAPPGVRPDQWLAMLDAAGRFLDRWGAKAAALGWTAAELFGLDEASPMGRLDRRGAAYFLAGAEILAVTAEAVTIRRDGAVQTIRRRAGFTMPAWERGRG